LKRILSVLATVFLLFSVIGAVQAGLPPVADVKGPYWAGVSDLIVFDGSGSYDPDGFRKEEIRGLFVLGLLAVLSSIRVQNDEMMVSIGQISFNIIPFFVIGCVAILGWLAMQGKKKR